MSRIEWTDETWNPVRGCARVSPGCENCYAERQAHRFSGEGMPYEGLTRLTKKGPRWTGRARFVPDKLAEPLRWRKPHRVFVNSMSDLFHDDVTNEQIAAVFGVMAACPKHTFQVLTKRPGRMVRWFEWLDEGRAGVRVPPPNIVCHTAAVLLDGATQLVAVMGTPYWRAVCAARPVPWPLPNVWIGVSVEDQATADERIPLLLQCPAAVRFVSYEPALGPVDFRPSLGLEWERCDACGRRYPDVYWGDDAQWQKAVSSETAYGLPTGGLRCPDCFRKAVMLIGEEPRLEMLAPPLTRLDWVIVGGESGPGARPFDVEWARSTIAQCREAEVPCFVKQLGPRPFERAASFGDRQGYDPADMLGGADAPRPPQMAGWTRIRTATETVYQRHLELRDRKGGDMSEWPEDLRVREFPEALV